MKSDLKSASITLSNTLSNVHLRLAEKKRIRLSFFKLQIPLAKNRFCVKCQENINIYQNKKNIIFGV